MVITFLPADKGLSTNIVIKMGKSLGSLIGAIETAVTPLSQQYPCKILYKWDKGASRIAEVAKGRYICETFHDHFEWEDRG